MRGVFIAFEGPDGSGKTTVAGQVTAALDESGIPVLLTREPGGTELGQDVRRILLDSNLARDPITELLLMCADRAEHVRTVLRPALERGACVISDRYAASTRAYQGSGLGLDLSVVEQAIQIATGGLEPDLTILFDVPGSIALDRRRGRLDAQNDIDRRSVEFHERVREGFLEQARNHPDTWKVIDASQPVALVIQTTLKMIEAIVARKSEA